MQIKFLGTGSAFDFEKGTSAAIVTLNGKQILIDCGFSTILRLHETGLLDTIDYVLITHLHADHIGSLPTLLPYCKYRRDKGSVEIIIPSQIFRAELDTLLSATFAIKQAHYVPIEEFSEIGHIDTTNQHVKGMTSYAYYFSEGDELIYYSGDIGNADTAKTFLSSRSESNITVFHGTSPNTETPTHTQYQEVQDTLSDYDVYAYHVAKENMPEDCTLKLVENYPELLA